MDLFTPSLLAHGFSASWSDKQRELKAVFLGLLAELQINVFINPTPKLRAGLYALDIEHDEEGVMVGIGICQDKDCFYFTEITETLKTCIEKSPLIAHNGLSDFDCLRSWGINVRNEQLVHDTMLIGHVADSSLKSYGLKDMAKRDLGIIYPSYEDIVGKRTLKQKAERLTLDKQPIELVALYNAMDCYVTYQIYLKQTKGRCDNNSTSETPVSAYFTDLEKPVSNVFDAMSTRGVRVDLEYLAGLKLSLEVQQRPIKEAIFNELGDINLNSPKQLLEALNEKGITPTLKGKPSTDKRALVYKQDESIIRLLLEYSELETLLSSFVNPYLERGAEFVHPYFNQTGTRTGRLSCSNPNLLQIPRRTENGKLVRRMFIPRDGFTMGDCDYGQIEPRVLAHLSKDPALCQLFNDGIDFHDFTANNLGISREKAKVLNLSVGYRATFKSVSAQLKCSDSEAQNEINKWWALFPVLRRWQDALIYESKRSGICTTLLGRRIKIDALNHGNSWRREGAERQLINNITQGSAAEIMKTAMVRLAKDDLLSPTFGLLVQVYDELLWESESAEYDELVVVDNMENAVKLDVPLTVDCKIGSNWAEAH